MRLVIVESPYAGDVHANEVYARAAMRDCLNRGEAPYASHLLYTQPGVLDDLDPTERRHGIDAGLAWGDKADATVVYTDRGMSTGMRYGVQRANQVGRPVLYRSLNATTDGPHAEAGGPPAESSASPGQADQGYSEVAS